MLLHEHIYGYNDYQNEIKRKQKEIRLLKIERDKHLTNIGLFLSSKKIDGFEYKECGQIFTFKENKRGEQKVVVISNKPKIRRNRKK